jgi:hypothetical protein
VKKPRTVRVSKAFWEALAEIHEDHIHEIKEMVKATMEKIRVCENAIKLNQETVAGLKADLADLKKGRIDRIRDRRQKMGATERDRLSSPINPTRLAELANGSYFTTSMTSNNTAPLVNLTNASVGWVADAANNVAAGN